VIQNKHWNIWNAPARPPGICLHERSIASLSLSLARTVSSLLSSAPSVVLLVLLNLPSARIAHSAHCSARCSPLHLDGDACDEPARRKATWALVPISLPCPARRVHPGLLARYDNMLARLPWLSLCNGPRAARLMLVSGSALERGGGSVGVGRWRLLRLRMVGWSIYPSIRASSQTATNDDGEYRCGCDTHRSLCGFSFVSDGTLSVTTSKPPRDASSPEAASIAAD